jgi:hypothetical protein
MNAGILLPQTICHLYASLLETAQDPGVALHKDGFLGTFRPLLSPLSKSP